MKLDLINNSKMLLILVNVILGSILLYSYYYYIRYGRATLPQLWGDAYPYRKYFMVSMMAALIGYLLVLSYGIFVAKKSKALVNLAIIQLVIIAVSMLWLPLTLKYLQSRDKLSRNLYMFAIIVVLFMVAVTSIKQYLIVEKLIPTNKNKINKTFKTVALVGAGAFIFQTFATDFMAWDVGFFIPNP